METNKISYLTNLGYWLFVIIPSPFYFAIYGAVRQIIHKSHHHLLISTLIIMSTITIIYGTYYIAGMISHDGIDKIYWRGFLSSPAYVLPHGAYPTAVFYAGGLLVKIVQYLIRRFSQTVDKQPPDC